MITLRDKTSHLFLPSLVVVKIPKDVVVRAILEYNRVGYPIQHINRHETTLLKRTTDDDHIVLLLPSALSDTTSSWSFILPQSPVTS